jgi:hypothetical protein
MMKEVAMGRVKNLDEIKAMVRERTGKRNTFRHAKREDVEAVLANLTSKDPELWAREWSRVAEPYEALGAKLEKAGKFNEAREAYVQAYAYYATGRYPTPHTPGKMACFRKSLEVYEKAGRYFEPAAGASRGSVRQPEDSDLRSRSKGRPQTFNGHQLRRHRFVQSRKLRVR